jgi:hypothetical protein
MSMNKTAHRDRTPSEVLIETLETFGESECKKVLVVFVDANDDVVIESNVRRLEALGMLEMSKDMILRGPPR